MEIPTHQRGPDTSAAKAPWAKNLLYLWSRRRTLLWVGVIAFILSTTYAFVVPQRYSSSTSIMPPEPQSGSAAMLAMLAGHQDARKVGPLFAHGLQH